MLNTTFGKVIRTAAAIAAIGIASPATAEVPLGDDGLHKPDWLQETFLDLREDLAEANAQGKRLLVMVEQRGCIYCTKMHEEVFPDLEIDEMIRENFYVVQVNLFGDLEVTDFDGTVLSEKDAAARWRVVFTPTMMFMPEEVEEGMTAPEAAVAVMPGAFMRATTLAMFTWIRDKAYETEPNFQRYFAEHFYPGTSG